MGEKRSFPKPKSPRVIGHPSRRAKTPLRAGLYARVSTQDQQTIPMQTRSLREYATPPWFFRDGDSFALAVAVVPGEL